MLFQYAVYASQNHVRENVTEHNNTYVEFRLLGSWSTSTNRILLLACCLSTIFLKMMLRSSSSYLMIYPRVGST